MRARARAWLKVEYSLKYIACTTKNVIRNAFMCE